MLGLKSWESPKVTAGTPLCPSKMKLLGHEEVARLKGSPLRAVKMPENVQPPTMAFTQPGASAKKGRPRPTGSSQMPFTLKRWRMSKSEFARQTRRLRASQMSPPEVVTLATVDWLSMECD